MIRRTFWGYIYIGRSFMDANTGIDPMLPGGIWWDEALKGIWWTNAPIYVPIGSSPCLGFTRLNDATGVADSFGPWYCTDRSPRFVEGTITGIPASWSAAHLGSGRWIGIAGATGSGMAQAPIGTALLAVKLFDPFTTPAQKRLDAPAVPTIHGNGKFLLLHDLDHRQSRDLNYRQCKWGKDNGGPETCGAATIVEPVPTWCGNEAAIGESDNAACMTWIDTPTKRGVVYLGTLVRFPRGAPGVAHGWYGKGPENGGRCCHGQTDPAWSGITGTGTSFRNPTGLRVRPNSACAGGRWETHAVESGADDRCGLLGGAIPIGVPCMSQESR